MAEFIPAQYQPALPLDKLILQDGAPGAGDRMELDVAVLEKAEALGEHSLSGAVVNPRAFRELFPDLTDSDFPLRAPVGKEAVYLLTAGGKWRLPTPPS